jgi:hypothetical protein
MDDRRVADRASAGPNLLENWRDPGIADLDSNGALEESDRQHEAMLPPEIQQDSVQATKRAIVDSHSLSNLQERPGLAWKPRLDCRLYRGNLGFVNGDGNLAHSDDENNPRGYDNGKPIQWVEPTKNIPREKWPLDVFEPVRPPASALMQRQKPFIALTAQVLCDDILGPTSDL